MITCGGINANLCRYRYSGILLSSCPVSERIVGLHHAYRKMGRRVNGKNKDLLVEIGGAKALWLCGYKVGKIYKLASNWNHGSKTRQEKQIENTSIAIIKIVEKVQPSKLNG